MNEFNGIYGIVCEFNPFHCGHALLLQQIRAQGARAVICAMSGNFVQRGEPAVFSKWIRARCAVEAGADLVLELPVSFAVSGAERFARGGVALLQAAGCGALAFGSEEGQIPLLEQAARVLSSKELAEQLHRELAAGAPFAVARSKAVKKLAGPQIAALLSFPNNILGIEYIRAAYALQAPLRFLTIQRQGATHQGEGEAGYSATRLREQLRAGEDITPLVPPETVPLLQKALAAGVAPVDWITSERAVLAVLRRLKPGDFARLPDISEGIENRFCKAVGEASSLQELFGQIKSKRYTLARIRRLVLSAFLGLETPLPDLPPYLKVLAANPLGLSLLKQTDLPVIVNHQDTKDLSTQAKQVYEEECRADDLYTILQPVVGPCGMNQQVNFRFPL